MVHAPTHGLAALVFQGGQVPKRLSSMLSNTLAVIRAINEITSIMVYTFVRCFSARMLIELGCDMITLANKAALHFLIQFAHRAIELDVFDIYDT